MKTIYPISMRWRSAATALLLVSGFSSVAQQTYTFTTCGATGSVGPTQTQVTATYSSTSLNGMVTSTLGVQHWTVPVSGVYRVSALGAQGAGAGGGFAAHMQGDFTLTAGQVVRVVVGQQGITQPGEPNACGGGGGSYVVLGTTNSTANIMVIAGGGGGSPATYSNSCHASTTTTGNWGAGANNTDGAPGNNGSGGNKSVSANSLDRGAGGGGFLTDGQSIAQTAGRANGGKAFVNGSEGGSHNDMGAAGGFGGGGAVWTTGFRGGGGGGGYSGGGGGQTNSNSNTHVGGGGGSINSGSNQTNAVGTFTGDGRVVVTELCPITLVASGATNSLNPLICAGQSLTLTTNAVSNYSWSTGVTGTNQIIVSPTTNTVYTVTGTSSLNCTTSRSMSVTVSSGMPVLSISATSNSVCLGDSVAITVSGALSYVYSHSIMPGVYFKPTTTTTYSISGTNGCGTTNATTVINVYQLPVLAVVNPSQVCANTGATLTGGGAVTYTWIPGNFVGNNVSVFPAATTIYTVTGKSGGCLGQSTVQLLAKPNPTIIAMATKSIICDGETVTITVTGANTYTWTNSSLTGSVVTVTPSVPIAYDVSGTNSVGCTSGGQQIVIVYPKPQVTASGAPALICVGASASLSAFGANTYTWSHGPGSAATIVSPVTTTNYVVIGTETVHGCTMAVTVPVNVYQATISVSQNTFICPGGSAVISAGPATSYTWMHGGSSASSTVNPSSVTIYTINATGVVNNMTCIRTNTVQIGVFPAAVITATAHRTTICRNETTTLTASGGNTYLWNTGSTSSVVVITGLAAGPLQFTVTGTDQNTCKDSHTLSVIVSNCTGIKEQSASAVKVYPNPSHGLLTIESPVGSEVVVTSNLGQVIRKFSAGQNTTGTLQLSDLSKGVYLITVSSDPGHVTKVIVD